MQWPEILFIFSSEMLCINEAHVKAGQKAKKRSLKLIGREKALKTWDGRISRQKLVSGKVEENLQAA